MRHIRRRQGSAPLGPPEPIDPGLGLGIPGFTDEQRPSTWDALVSTHAPLLTGDVVHFVALADGTLVVEEEVPDDSLSPLADAVEEELRPPYRAEAQLQEDGVWLVGARPITVVELPAETAGDLIAVSRVGGEVSALVDGGPGDVPQMLADLLPAADGVVNAERIDDTLWVVETFEL